MYKFPDRLKSLMLELNLSQNQLSKETKIPQSTVARWLSNQQTPNVYNLITLSQYFKCSIDYLVGMVD